MEFIVCDAQKMELGSLLEGVSVDLDIGDTNDAEIIAEKGYLNYGMYIICPGTEYGVLLEEKDSWTSGVEETWKGNTFRGFLKQFIICPPEGQDYLKVNGDAHDILRQVLGNAFDGMFTIPELPSGIILNGNFDRYTDALTGFTKLLDAKGARLNIEIKQGGSNEPFLLSFPLLQKAICPQKLSIPRTLSGSTFCGVQTRDKPLNLSREGRIKRQASGTSLRTERWKYCTG